MPSLAIIFLFLFHAAVMFNFNDISLFPQETLRNLAVEMRKRKVMDTDHIYGVNTKIAVKLLLAYGRKLNKTF